MATKWLKPQSQVQQERPARRPCLKCERGSVSVPRYLPSLPTLRACAGAAVPPLLVTAILAQLTGTAAAAVDTTAPAPVTGMKTSADTSRVKLDWATSTAADRKGYLVYRSDAADGTFTKLTATPRSSSDFSDSTAPKGFPSFYKVTVVDTSGNESTPVSASATRKDGVKPLAVTSLTATRTDEGISLDWADNSEADLAGYVVTRATSSGGTYTKLTSAPLAGSSFVDTAAEAGRNYWYKVSAVDFSGYSSSTVRVAALVPDITPPPAVTSLAATASTSGIKLDWPSVSVSDRAGYHVYRSAAAEGPFTRLTATPRTSSDYSDTTAPVGALSYYRVVTVDTSGNESTPVSASATRKDGVRPAAPAALTATAVPDGVLLDWADNGEADLAGYVVSRATSSGGTYTKLTTSPLTSSTFTDATAPAGRVSYYRVSAVDASGNVSSTAGASASPKDETAPAPVSGLVVSADSSRVKLDWTSSSESDRAGYHVYRSATPEGEFTRLTTEPRTSSDYPDYAATPGVVSYYRVTVVDTSGNESAPVSANGTRRDTAAPAAVTGLTADGTAAGVALDWADSTATDLAGYVVSRAATSGGTYTRLTSTPVTESTFVDSEATEGTTFFYRVAAVDLSGNTSSASSTVSAARPDATAPAAATGLAAVREDGQVRLSWTRSTSADVVSYEVLRASGEQAAVRIGSVPATSYVDTDVTEAAGYTYVVRAVDANGNVSTDSQAVSVAEDATPPAAPTGLTAGASGTGVLLDWADVADAGLAGYRVYRSEAGGEAVLLTEALVSASTFTDTAAPATGASYRVTAVDRAGNESATSDAAVFTPADTTAPAAPTAIEVTATAEGITLDWADNVEGDLAEYVVSRSASPAGSYVELGPTSASVYVDTTAPAGATSYYRVTALDKAGNESAAAAAQATRLIEKAPVAGVNVTVAQDGSGDYTTVAAALAAAPAAGDWVIGIRPGTYRELLTVQRANVTLLGATSDASDVVITYDNAAGTAKPGGGTYGTSGSATVFIRGNNVTTRNLTIENSYVETGTGSEQAVALRTTGDRLVFDNVRVIGDQDTLLADSPAAGALARSYYVNSYIEGDVDFIFGRGTVVIDRSAIKAATRGSTSNNGYVTAASTDKSLTYGYLITDSAIVSDAPAGTFHLGRPWQPSGDVNAIAQVVIRNTALPAAVKSSPWTDMSGSLWRNARFFEYQNTGAGAAVTADRPQLTTTEAARYTKFTYLAGADGWNPTGQDAPPPPADTTAPDAVTGLAAEAADSSVTLTWAASGASDLAGYNVYRSTGETVALTGANLITTATGTTYTDRTAANGPTYRYVVTAVDRAGNESPASSSVTAEPIGVPLPAHDILVAADGTGQYDSVQAAVNAAPAGTAAKPTVIAVKPGLYKELVAVTKNYVTIIGTTGEAGDVLLTYDNAAGTPNPATGATYGTSGSQTVLIKGNNVTVRDLTIENSFDEAAFNYSSEQAVALQTTGDRLVFDNIRLLGNQDTLLANSGDAPVIARSYFVDSYIEGDVDFIFGRGTAVFHRTTIHALSRGSSSNNGYITAASTSDHNPHGFLIVDSTITSNAPAGTYSLGRPWRGWSDGYTKNGVVYNSRGQVTVRNTELPAAIRTTQPWADMSPNLWTDGRFSEYGNTGAGAGVNASRPQLTDEQAATATPEAYLAGSDGWNPVR